jgi:hypothetical protein
MIAVATFTRKLVEGAMSEISTWFGLTFRPLIWVACLGFEFSGADDVGKVIGERVRIVGVAEVLEREGHVVGAEGLAVLPLHARMQIKGIALVVA